jgi:sugar O-acyltransferase (sialic acid O-acetyltransferase NeuD family)
MTHFVRAPLVNVNDDEMTLVEWLKDDGAVIRVGEAIAVLETTKATADLEAEAAGVLRVLVDAGADIAVGQVLAAITASADTPIPTPPEPDLDESSTSAASPGAWTRKADIVARRAGLDLAELNLIPQDGLRITEADVQLYLSAGAAPPSTDGELLPLPGQAGLERVLVIGAGGAALQILDVINQVPGQRAVGLVDDNPGLQGRSLMGVPIMGTVAQMPDLMVQDRFDAVIISIGLTTELRAALFARVSGWEIPFTNVIDPAVQIRSHVALGTGNAIMPFSYLGAAATIGSNNFISTYVNIEHHTRVGSHCTFGPGVMTSGAVRIGDRVKFGTGVFLEPHVEVGSDSIVASGAILTRSVPPHSVVKTRANFSIRARKPVDPESADGD